MFKQAEIHMFDSYVATKWPDFLSKFLFCPLRQMYSWTFFFFFTYLKIVSCLSKVFFPSNMLGQV